MPRYEIFVYSPRVEGVHLRFGNVARGGLRWSDREEDYRTEVLGLVKAQQVKNSVIVPVGAKGGFVPRRLPTGGSRDDIQAEAIACYRIFISGLLDITDNLKDGEVVPPAAVVRYDGDDPYLVVAADKGTATFSDIANGIAQDYGFWLDDAFASGGSAGLRPQEDGHHLAGRLGQRAAPLPGARHRRPDRSVTVVGIGEWPATSSATACCVRASWSWCGLNHLHIFIDPNPDAERSYVERERLFNLPRSSWTDYDASLISQGVASSAQCQAHRHQSRDEGALRSAGRSPDAQRADQRPAQGAGGSDLERRHRHLRQGQLRKPCRHRRQGQRRLRVDGCDLRAKVIGEGGNLA